MEVKSIRARKIKDSRSAETIEVSVNGQKASAPSGKSTGKYESKPFHKSLDWNIHFINNFHIDFQVSSFSDLKKVENLIKKKAKLRDVKKFGANALFALECAILKALAKDQKKELWEIINPRAKRFPYPLGNAVGGGLHSHNKDAPEFQEFLLIPSGKTFKQRVKNLDLVYKKLKKALGSKKKNDEGAWQTSLSNESIISLVSNYKEVKLGMDIAANSFYKSGSYKYQSGKLSRDKQISFINKIIKNYSPTYIEDPLQEQDFSGFSKIKKKHMICGDDLTATQISRLKKAIKMKSINAMIVKPNQNGSLIELSEIVKLCKKHNIKTIISHRSGETLDSALADLAFGFQSDYIKCGISTKWRRVKLKRLLQIEKYF